MAPARVPAALTELPRTIGSGARSSIRSVIFSESNLSGAHLVELEPRGDHRGFNARAWCRQEMTDAGIDSEMVQANVLVNPHRGTLRGLHFQHPPHTEAKLVRVTHGAIYDVVVDLRAESPTFGQWAGFELRRDPYRALYVPERFAHGLLTLEDDTEVTYMVSSFYAPGHEGGLRHDDPALGIEWPAAVRLISDKDRSWPDFDPATHGLREPAEAAR
jgi:dTDP-4-dehydrorhamnose 3,5-epimerase